jgi:hypothetical protein
MVHRGPAIRRDGPSACRVPLPVERPASRVTLFPGYSQPRREGTPPTTGSTQCRSSQRGDQDLGSLECTDI